MDIEKKQCQECKELKPIYEFKKRKLKTKDYIYKECQKCMKEKRNNRIKLDEAKKTFAYTRFKKRKR